MCDMFVNLHMGITAWSEPGSRDGLQLQYILNNVMCDIFVDVKHVANAWQQWL